jgi:hypothetical protein
MEREPCVLKATLTSRERTNWELVAPTVETPAIDRAISDLEDPSINITIGLIDALKEIRALLGGKT